MTKDVQDYILFYQHRGTPYEIHLIDSPGFDDDVIGDADVLSSIADYVNTNYKLKEQLAGVLYLHDITKARIGGVGQRNIRMLEKLIGLEKFNNWTVVTTKWGCTTSPQDEQLREKSLGTDPDLFGSMLQERQHQCATMKRFDPKSKGRALEIIKPYLGKAFTPQITRQMVDPKGPKLSLGETEAGKVVADYLKKLEQRNLELEKVQAAQSVLSQKYDETLFEEFKQKRKKLRRHIRLQRSGRWIMRTTIVGGAIVATVLTLGPGASAFALEPAYEKAVRGQRRKEARDKVELEEEFKKRSKDANYLKNVDARWLWNSKVRTLQDLDDRYSVRSLSSDNLLKVAKRGETVGFATEGGKGNGKGPVMVGKEMGSDSESESGEDWSDMSDPSG